MSRAANNAIFSSSTACLREAESSELRSSPERSYRSFGAMGGHQADVTVSSWNIQPQRWLILTSCSVSESPLHLTVVYNHFWLELNALLVQGASVTQGRHGVTDGYHVATYRPQHAGPSVGLSSLILQPKRPCDYYGEMSLPMQLPVCKKDSMRPNCKYRLRDKMGS